MNNQLENKLSSREVAQMMELKQHSDLLRKIDGINEDFTQSKIAFSKYWVEGTYIDGSGKSNREFQITKKGCEFLAHKTTGTKGNLFTDKYMDKFAAMENIINNTNHPIGILESLQNELQATKQEVAELRQAVYSDKRMKLSRKEKQLGISAPMSEKLSLIPDETILEIIKIALESGLLRELDEGIAVDKKIVLEEAEKRHIAKSALNKKLLLMSIVVPNKDNYAYKQIREEGSSRWCYVIRNVVNN
jgi:phage regulator Rha-like protein